LGGYLAEIESKAERKPFSRDVIFSVLREPVGRTACAAPTTGIDK
jgi:hypothetical protein